MRRFSTTANESHSDRQFQQSDETQLNNPIFIGDNGIALETISSNTSDDSSRSGYSTQELSHLMTSTNPPKIDGGLPQLYYSILQVGLVMLLPVHCCHTLKATITLTMPLHRVSGLVTQWGLF